MKKSLRNFVLACTATAAVSLALATSAFAANGYDITADITYDQAAGTVTISGDFLGTLDGQTTILIYEESVDPANISAEQILYINQDDADTGANTFVNMGVKGGLTENTTYVVRMGGENVSEGIYEGTFKVGEGEVHLYPLGDADLSGSVTSADAGEIISHDLGLKTLEGEALECADADRSGSVTSADAGEVISHDLGLKTLTWD